MWDSCNIVDGTGNGEGSDGGKFGGNTRTCGLLELIESIIYTIYSVVSRRTRPLAPTALNHVWAYDFVFDTCADGRSLKCLTVVDEFTRECLAIDVAGSIRSGRVIDVLGQLVSLHGAPRYLRSDNGPEFIAIALLRWLQTAEIDTAFIDPGKPWQNGTDESFQRAVPERMSIPRVVSESDGGRDRDRTLAATLQRRTSST